MAFKINNTTVISGTSAAPALADEHSRSYPAVKIGDQIWMAKNLDVIHYRDGTPIPGILNENHLGGWDALTTGAYTTYDPTDGMPPIDQEVLPIYAIKPIYGLLYNWYAVDGDDGGGSGTRELAPDGWHIPTDAEWTTLETYLNSSEDGSMLAGQKVYWQTGTTPSILDSSDFGATGFNGLPAGYRSGDNGDFGSVNSGTWFWSSSEMEITGHAWMRQLYVQELEVYRNMNKYEYGFSVRCIRD